MGQPFYSIVSSLVGLCYLSRSIVSSQRIPLDRRAQQSVTTWCSYINRWFAYCWSRPWSNGLGHGVLLWTLTMGTDNLVRSELLWAFTQVWHRPAGFHKDLMKQALQKGLHDSQAELSLCTHLWGRRGWKFCFINEKHGQDLRRLVKEPSVCLAKQQHCRHWFPVLPRHRCPCSAWQMLSQERLPLLPPCEGPSEAWLHPVLTEPHHYRWGLYVGKVSESFAQGLTTREWTVVVVPQRQ